MKRIGQFSLMIVAVILLVACGGLPPEVSGGLTSAMMSNRSQEEAPAPYMELKAARCEGTMDSVTNLLQVSFQLTTDVEDLGSAGEQTHMFGGGTGLLAQLGKTEPGTYAVSCDGEAEVAAVPLLVNGKAVSWITGLKAPQLLLTSPSGEKTALKDVLLHGLTAKSDKEIPGILQAVYGVSMEDGYQSFFATQKLLVEEYPSTAFFEEQALENGLSKENVARFVAMAGETDVAKQRALLLDIVTSENKAYVETVVGTTIKSLLAVGATPNEITDLFMEETKGRITVNFSAETVASPTNLTVTLMDQDGGNVTVAAEEPRNEDDGGESGGGDPPPPDDGGDPPPDDGNNGNGNGNGNGGGRTWRDFLRDLMINTFHGAAAGAALGAIEGGVGAIPGSAIGAGVGIAYTVLGGVVNPLPDPDNPDADPNNNPCNQPWVNC